MSVPLESKERVGEEREEARCLKIRQDVVRQGEKTGRERQREREEGNEIGPCQRGIVG